jgi:hypothetical protein
MPYGDRSYSLRSFGSFGAESNVACVAPPDKSGGVGEPPGSAEAAGLGGSGIDCLGCGYMKSLNHCRKDAVDVVWGTEMGKAGAPSLVEATAEELDAEVSGVLSEELLLLFVDSGMNSRCRANNPVLAL